jgi:hypothetical protein
VIEDQKIVVRRTTTIKRASKPQAMTPASKSFFIQHQNDEYLNDLRKFENGKRGSENLFLLFPFSNLFYLFLLFYFIKCKGEQKQMCSGKGEKKMVDLGVREKNSNANGGRRVEMKIG